MKEMLQKLFWPVLQFFETGTEEYVYEPSHRIILLVVGLLFGLLTGASMYLTTLVEDMGVYIPVVVFAAVGITCFIVGSLGSDRAIAQIWKRKR